MIIEKGIARDEQHVRNKERKEAEAERKQAREEEQQRQQMIRQQAEERCHNAEQTVQRYGQLNTRNGQAAAMIELERAKNHQQKVESELNKKRKKKKKDSQGKKRKTADHERAQLEVLKEARDKAREEHVANQYNSSHRLKRKASFNCANVNRMAK